MVSFANDPKASGLPLLSWLQILFSAAIFVVDCDVVPTLLLPSCFAFMPSPLSLSFRFGSDLPFVSIMIFSGATATSVSDVHLFFDLYQFNHLIVLLLNKLHEEEERKKGWDGLTHTKRSRSGVGMVVYSHTKRFLGWSRQGGLVLSHDKRSKIEIGGGSICWSWQGGPINETHPEGSICWSWQGGPINETHPEGSICWSWQGGPINETHPEGSLCWSWQGGPINEIHPEGSMCWSWQGGPRTETHPEGSMCWSWQGGPRTETHPEGSMCWCWQGGPRTETHPEGSVGTSYVKTSSMCWSWQGGPRNETHPEGSMCWSWQSGPMLYLALKLPFCKAQWCVRVNRVGVSSRKRLTGSAVALVVGVSSRKTTDQKCDDTFCVSADIVLHDHLLEALVARSVKEVGPVCEGDRHLPSQAHSVREAFVARYTNRTFTSGHTRNRGSEVVPTGHWDAGYDKHRGLIGKYVAKQEYGELLFGIGVSQMLDTCEGEPVEDSVGLFATLRISKASWHGGTSAIIKLSVNEPIGGKTCHFLSRRARYVPFVFCRSYASSSYPRNYEVLLRGS
ncbi:hypothetical protein GQ457_04G009540 [Hibiscus cannabinus]